MRNESPCNKGPLILADDISQYTPESKTDKFGDAFVRV